MELYSPGVNRSQVAGDLRINPGMLARWSRKFDNDGMAAFNGHGKARDEEVAALKRELARVKREHDFFRHAVAFFANELKSGLRPLISSWVCIQFARCVGASRCRLVGSTPGGSALRAPGHARTEGF